MKQTGFLYRTMRLHQPEKLETFRMS